MILISFDTENFSDRAEVYFVEYLAKPWTHAAPYLIGVILGQVLHRTKRQLKIRTVPDHYSIYQQAPNISDDVIAGCQGRWLARLPSLSHRTCLRHLLAPARRWQPVVSSGAGALRFTQPHDLGARSFLGGSCYNNQEFEYDLSSHILRNLIYSLCNYRTVCRSSGCVFESLSVPSTRTSHLPSLPPPRTSPLRLRFLSTKRLLLLLDPSAATCAVPLPPCSRAAPSQYQCWAVVGPFHASGRACDLSRLRADPLHCPCWAGTCTLSHAVSDPDSGHHSLRV